jgi:hypothetical protein
MSTPTPAVELQLRATYRGRVSDYGIGAALDHEITEPDRDGRCWLCVVTDAMNGFRWVEPRIVRLGRGVPVEPEAIERAVERRAGSFRVETRLDDLADASPLWLRREELGLS